MLIVAVSCRDRSSALPLSDYVSAVLTDTSYTEYRIVREYAPDITGSVAVVGDALDVLPIVEDLILGDRFDNISGRVLSDGLADFAGERVDAYFHESSISCEEDTDRIRELGVRQFITALDTSCLYSLYDPQKTEHKARAKVVVLACPSFSSHGLHDIDTLCQLAGLKVPVVSSIDEMLKCVLEKHPNPAKITLWAPAERVATTDYNAVYRRNGGMEGGLRVISPAKGENDLWFSLMSFLDKYMEDGSMRQLSAVAVDDPSLDPIVLRAACDSLRNSTAEELIKYRNLLSKDFQFIFASEAVSRSCYSLLRGSNSFTHRIASPEASVYLVDGVNAVRLREALLSDSLRCVMEQSAPNLLSRHVRP